MGPHRDQGLPRPGWRTENDIGAGGQLEQRFVLRRVQAQSVLSHPTEKLFVCRIGAGVRGERGEPEPGASYGQSSSTVKRCRKVNPTPTKSEAVLMPMMVRPRATSTDRRWR